MVILFSVFLLSELQVEVGFRFQIEIFRLLLVPWHGSDSSDLHLVSLLEVYLLLRSPHNSRYLGPLSFSTTKSSSEAFS